jgi:hypothetical protein
MVCGKAEAAIAGSSLGKKVRRGRFVDYQQSAGLWEL